MPSEEPTRGPNEVFDRLEQAFASAIAPVLKHQQAFASAIAPVLKHQQAFASAIAPVLEQSEKLQRALGSAIAPVLERWSLQLPKVDEWFERIKPALELVADEWRRAWEEALPPNWEGLSTDDVFRAVDCVERTGYCLVWTPRAEIVHEILRADIPKIEAILLARRGDVLDDAVAVLADVTEPDLARERGAAADAIHALRAGHGKPAQALAASVFTSTLHLYFQTSKTKKIRRLMADKHPENAGLSELRLRTIYLAGARALDDYRPETGLPVRSEFNRHNTAHRITQEQWTDANALRAVMLVVALLRELNHWLVRNRTEYEARVPTPLTS